MNRTVNILPRSKGHVIFMRLSGMVTGGDYNEFVQNKLVETITEYGHYDILIHFDKDFQGWTEDGARISFQSITNYAEKTRNVAYVNAPDNLHMLLKIAEPLIRGEIFFFEEEEMDKAISWITSHPL